MPAQDEAIAARREEKDVKLYCAWFCPFAQRVWIALNELSVDYQYIECTLYEGGSHTKKSLPLDKKRELNPAFVDCCPRGLVPGLRNGEDQIYEVREAWADGQRQIDRRTEQAKNISSHRPTELD